MKDVGIALPDYGKPPIVEVVFAVALRPMSLSLVDLARFGWERLGDSYPARQEQSPQPVATESFDAGSQNLVPTLSLLTGAPPVRLWFGSEDKTRLVQLQRDWMAYNWQGTSTEGPYPKYETIERSFLSIFDSFADYVAQLRPAAPDVAPHQCELSYINHVFPGRTWERHGQLNKVIRLAGKAGSFLPEPEDGQLMFRYRIPHEGKDIGRLYVQVLPGRRDQSQVIQLNITARGAPLSPDREGMVSFFRLAHEWVVRGFAAVTTDAAQKMLWERIR
jgi:uncharacterized protein (TIGR04255 family)